MTTKRVSPDRGSARTFSIQDPRTPDSCLVCAGEMVPGLVLEFPTIGKTRVYQCTRGCSTEHRRVLESVGGSEYEFVGGAR